jgi:hypothetical protein
MNHERVLLFSIAVGLLSGTSGGCTLPETTRTASVHDVEIRETLSKDNILVQPGDEVRWINLRKDMVRIDIPNLESDDLACQRGFRSWYGGLREQAGLKPNQTVSLCFNKPAVVNYNVRAETSLPGGKSILPGVVKVGTPLK